MTKNKDATLMPVEHIAQSILILRGQRVLLDADLAALYSVETRRLNEQVRRNRDRFPADFIFELTDEEFAELERKVTSHDQVIVGILKAIRELMHAPVPKKQPIGFTANLDESE